jgi:hypothetical protein
VIDVDEDAGTLVVRKALDVAHGFRGYLRALEPERDLGAELLAERRAEAEREAADSLQAPEAEDVTTRT